MESKNLFLHRPKNIGFSQVAHELLRHFFPPVKRSLGCRQEECCGRLWCGFPLGELAVLYLPVKRRLVRVYRVFFEDEKLPGHVGSNWEVY